MRFCLMIEGQEGVEWKTWVDLATTAERFGFEALFRSDHYMSMFQPAKRSSLDAWMTIAGLAPLTTKLRFGTLVSPIGFRHPSQLAKAVVTADHISNGRVEVGVGAGWFTDEHLSFGFDFPDDGTRMAALGEYLEVLHLSWKRSDEPIQFEGAHYRLAGAVPSPKPIQNPRPRLIMGGLAKAKARALAARWADEYNLYECTPGEAAMNRRALHQACERIGRNPETLGISLNANILVGVNRSDLEKRATHHLRYQGLTTSPRDHLASLGEASLHGTPEEVLEQIDTFSQAGITRMMMQVFPHDDFEAIELIGTHIIPHVVPAGHGGGVN